MDIIYVQSPKEKNKLNLYLNDNNFYVRNSIKMREKHLSFYKENLKTQNQLKKKYPVPKILYSTSNESFHQRRNKIIDKLSPKYLIKDLVDVVNILKEDISFDDEDKEEKIERKNNTMEEDQKNFKDIKIDNEKEKNDDEVFLTRKNIFDKKNKIKNNSNLELLNDLRFANARSTNEAITSNNDIKKIHEQKNLYKTNLYFENYGKFKFTRKGLYYPINLKKYELPSYTGNNKEEREYFNYRKKIANPELEYNKISSFSEKLNRDLGEYDINYGKTLSRSRFTENPLTKKYMEVLPYYRKYKDVKQIENRYIGNGYKFKLLPLYNQKSYNLDKMGDKFYRYQGSKKEIFSKLNNIHNKTYINKSNFN